MKAAPNFNPFMRGGVPVLFYWIAALIVHGILAHTIYKEFERSGAAYLDKESINLVKAAQTK